MAQRSLIRVHMSVTTLDPRLARVMEPRAATPARRLQALAELTRAGVPTGVLAAPMIPGLNDAEMEKIMEAAKAAGVRHGGYILLRLPLELRQMFEEWLHAHFPDRARHVLSLIRQTRAGELNDPRFHHRFTGHGPYADLLGQRFAKASRRLGFAEARAQLDCGRFAIPGGVAAEMSGQMSLF
jgi:DNA repair photolyase